MINWPFFRVTPRLHSGQENGPWSLFESQAITKAPCSSAMRHGDPPPFTGREEMPRARRHTAPMPSSFPLDFFEHVYYTLLVNELLTRTICIKLDGDCHVAVVQETQRRFNEAASWIATVCWDERITNSNTAHHRVYGQTRSQFGLGEQPAPPPEPAACPQFGPRASIRYDARTYRLLPLDRVSLNTLEGRITAHLLPGQRQHEMLCDPDWKIGGAEVVWRGGTYFLHVTQSKEAPDVTEADEAIGVDLGICNVATDSEGEQFTGAEVRAKRSRFVARRAALQRLGTRSAKRRLKQMSGRERRYMKNVNHTISKALVHKAVVSRKALALEDLTGIRESGTVRREQRYERHAWAFFQLRLFLTYKAAWAGVEVRLVDPAYTSQTCSRCGYCAAANRHSQSSFRCQRCGFSAHADFNSATNIALAARQAANSSAGTSVATSPSRLRDVGT